MKTKMAIQDHEFKLSVLRKYQRLLEKLDASSCWCGSAFSCDEKVKFIKEACEIAGFHGYERRFTRICEGAEGLGSDYDIYPICLSWESFFEACCEIENNPQKLTMYGK